VSLLQTLCDEAGIPVEHGLAFLRVLREAFLEDKREREVRAKAKGGHVVWSSPAYIVGTIIDEHEGHNGGA
jgi:hypothetical protein